MSKKRCSEFFLGQRKERFFGNRRQQVLAELLISIAFLVLICVLGIYNTDAARVTDFTRKDLAPCRAFWFGTDWLGRDMLVRTLKGLSISILIGLLAAFVSACLALVLGIGAAAGGKAADSVISFVTDLFLGIPHILLLILISVCLGKGLFGVTVGIALTHWPSLTRLIRSEVIQLRQMPYIAIAGKLGKSKWYIAKKHMLPHLRAQFLVGLVLLFPHAILHEASVTFLGFGLSSDQPAIGVILSESMRYLITGEWWLALFPGVMLVAVVLVFYRLGQNLRRMLDPGSVHE